MKNKLCLTCGREMQRWGKTAAGTPRYRCSPCAISSVTHRPDTKIRHEHDRFVAWLDGVDDKDAVAKRYGISRRTLTKEFKQFFKEDPSNPPPFGTKVKLLIIDAKFIHGRILCTLIAVTEENKIYWQFAGSECYGTWYSFLLRFAPPEMVVADGEKGAARFVRRYWPNTAFQRCHFHMVKLVIQYLSRNPKDEAGKQILSLMYQLKNVKTHAERDRWKMFHKIWEKQFEKVFNEKNDAGNYAHKKLRGVRYILRHAMSNLFVYLDHPGCPNTTNLVEGWPNTAIAEGLRRHRGLRLRQKKTLVSIILSNLKRPKEKPTRKFP